MNWNWLQGMNDNGGKPVFAGQKLVVVGGSSGMGQQTAADVGFVPGFCRYGDANREQITAAHGDVRRRQR